MLRGPSRPTYHKPPQPESPALYISWPQADREVFRFSEELNEDGCSLSGLFFTSCSDSQSLVSEHPQERFFFFFLPVYLPASLLCQLLKGPQTSFNKKNLSSASRKPSPQPNLQAAPHKLIYFTEKFSL